MICSSCAHAGDNLRDRKIGIPEFNAPMQTIVELHRACKYPTSCPCQHDPVGRWINDAKVTR